MAWSPTEAMMSPLRWVPVGPFPEPDEDSTYGYVMLPVTWDGMVTRTCERLVEAFSWPGYAVGACLRLAATVEPFDRYGPRVVPVDPTGRPLRPLFFALVWDEDVKTFGRARRQVQQELRDIGLGDDARRLALLLDTSDDTDAQTLRAALGAEAIAPPTKIAVPQSRVPHPTMRWLASDAHDAYRRLLDRTLAHIGHVHDSATETWLIRSRW